MFEVWHNHPFPVSGKRGISRARAAYYPILRAAIIWKWSVIITGVWSDRLIGFDDDDWADLDRSAN